MRIFTFIFVLLALSVAHAQESFKIPLDDGLYFPGKMAKDVQLNGGFISGDFSKMKHNSYVVIRRNKFIVRHTDRPICFNSYDYNVSQVQRIRFNIDFEGKGSLDNASMGVIHDWIDVKYFIDGAEVLLGDGGHTFNGVPSHLDQDWIELKEESQIFNLQVCMLNTGGDESYVMSNLNIDYESKAEEKEEVDIRENKFNFNNTTELGIGVYPNPTFDWLHIKNESDFNLNNIELFNLAGQSLGLVNYPVNVKELTAGVYFLKAERKDTKKFNTAQFVVEKP